jgi:hypothetical protein
MAALHAAARALATAAPAPATAAAALAAGKLLVVFDWPCFPAALAAMVRGLPPVCQAVYACGVGGKRGGLCVQGHLAFFAN